MPRREAILISDFQRGGWQGGEGVRLPDGAVLTPVVDHRHGKEQPRDRAGLAAAVGVPEPAADHGDDRRRQSHRRRGVERRDHARNRRPRDPVPARQRRGPGIGVDHVRSRHRRRPQRARDGASRRRRARARQRVPFRRVAGRSGRRHHRRDARDRAEHEPVSDPRRRGQRGAAHRRQGPPGRLALERGPRGRRRS